MRRGWDHLDITARRVRMNCYYVWFQYVPILPVSFLMTPVELKCRNVRPMRYAPVVGNFWKISKRSTLWTLMDSTDSKIDFFVVGWCHLLIAFYRICRMPSSQFDENCGVSCRISTRNSFFHSEIGQIWRSGSCVGKDGDMTGFHWASL